MVFTRTQGRRLALDYSKGRKPALVISPLEALAVLVALKLLYGETPREKHTRVQIVPTITNNRGNGAQLNKLVSTKFPSSAVLMELATCMRKMSLRTVVEWAPREGNKEADKLANGKAEDFDPSLRVHVDASTLCWDILPAALEAGAAERKPQEAREHGTFLNRSCEGKRRKLEERLRVTDPWRRFGVALNSVPWSSPVTSAARQCPAIPRLFSCPFFSPGIAFGLCASRFLSSLLSLVVFPATWLRRCS